ncbi:hypothetical protein DUI87_18294 [Hirundo rustica rustica]|uniref:Uncharacterized protein n=1 Tax=Hirundo rustica rustica TaxID=333673 RepID=A0A3M0JVQ6_HIRRU|nr:hypothetical protein DUI87_18294 [Hirundo rustica rustica]
MRQLAAYGSQMRGQNNMSTAHHLSKTKHKKPSPYREEASHYRHLVLTRSTNYPLVSWRGNRRGTKRIDYHFLKQGTEESKAKHPNYKHGNLASDIKQEQPLGTLDLRAQKTASSARAAEESPAVETLKTQFDKILSS